MDALISPRCTARSNITFNDVKERMRFRTFDGLMRGVKLPIPPLEFPQQMRPFVTQLAHRFRDA